MTTKEVYQSLKNKIDSRLGDNLKQLQAMTSDDAISAYKVNVEELSVQDGKYPGTGGIRTFITGRDNLTYDFIDLDKYYISDEVDLMLEEEKSEREAADQTLQDNIDKETERAETAELILQDNIDKEEARAETAESDLNQKIIDERDARVSSDDVLKALIEALLDKLIYFDDHFVCKSNNADGWLNWDKDAGIYFNDSHYGDLWIDAVGADSIPLCFAVTINGTTYQYCINMKTGYAYYRYGDVGEGSLADIPWIPVDSDLQNQITQEIQDRKLAIIDERNGRVATDDNLQAQIDDEIVDRKSADEQLVDWSKQYFVSTIMATSHSPLALDATESWDINGYKKYTIAGTVDCYSKDDVKEMVDELELSIYELQSQINGITSTRVETVTDINASGTSPLTLNATKEGNIVTINGSVDLSGYQGKLNYYSEGNQCAYVGGANDNKNRFGRVEVDLMGDVYLQTGNSGSKEHELMLDKNGNLTLDKSKVLTEEDIPDLSGYLTKTAAAETYQGKLTAGDNITIDSNNVISADVDLSEYQKKLECYTENSGGVSIETPDIGYGTVKLDINGGNSLNMQFTNGKATTTINRYGISVANSESGARITVDGAKVLTEGDDWDEMLALRDFYGDRNTGESIGSLSVDKNVCFVSLSGDRTLGLAEELPYGRTIVAMIHNISLNSSYTISGINEGNFTCMNGLDELVVPAGSNACIVISSIRMPALYYAVTAYNSEPVAKKSDIQGGYVYPEVHTDIPTDIYLDKNQFYDFTINGDTSIEFHSTGSVSGCEVHMIIYAESASTVTIKGTYLLATDGYKTFSMEAGKYLEINAIYSERNGGGTQRILTRSSYYEQ